jgi:uncharacterized membrane protein YhfC
VARALQQVDAYWSMAWYDSLLGAVERLFALPIQVALAVLVLQAFTRKQWTWVGLAVAYHALVDAAAVLALPYAGVYGTEAVVGGLAVVSLVVIFVLRRPEPAPVPESVRPVPPVAFTPRPIEETPERLDDTRYV